MQPEQPELWCHTSCFFFFCKRHLADRKAAATAGCSQPRGHCYRRLRHRLRTKCSCDTWLRSGSEQEVPVPAARFSLRILVGCPTMGQDVTGTSLSNGWWPRSGKSILFLSGASFPSGYSPPTKTRRYSWPVGLSCVVCRQRGPPMVELVFYTRQ